jgi:hypothetical protein
MIEVIRQRSLGERCVALATTTALLLVAAAPPAGAQPRECIAVHARGVLTLPFNPAFLHVAQFRDARGRPREGLLMSSFFNVEKDAEGRRVERYLERDLAAWIPDIAGIDPAKFDPKRQLEVLTDRVDGPPKTVWPNENDRVPDGVLPFQGVIVPGGFLSAEKPGRLTIVNLDDPSRAEYVVAEAGTAKPQCRDGKVVNEQWYYHQVVFHDMDGDGRKDVVTARASFKPFLHGCPPAGELLWFRNPGPALKPEVPWQAHVLVGLPRELDGPEVNMDLADLDGDGTPEIIATHFFTNDHISIFGAPRGMPWSAVDPAQGLTVRRKAIMSGQGRPFAVEAVDLDLDGRLEVLTSNHQGDGCFEVTKDAIPGRVLALVPPDSGRIFEDEWTTQVLKDGIRPHPTLPQPARGPGRLAPNRAVAFWPRRSMEGRERPWIVVGGDEASKVWVLRPVAPKAKRDWRYESFVIFDINDHYGPGTTQTLLESPRGVKIGTIGGLTWRYDRPGPDGRAEIWAPVFEARQIHVFSFRPGSGKPVSCGTDQVTACPAPESAAR